MKKVLCLLVVLGVVALFTLKLDAATTSGPITVTANIQAGTPDMTVAIYKMPQGDWQQINWQSPVTSMAFDKFTVVQRTGQSPQWTTVDMFVAFCYSDGLGTKYQIKSTGTGTFTKGGDTLPNGSFSCIPVYAEEDGWDFDGDGVVDATQGPMPSGAVLGSDGMALSSNLSVYTSDNNGTARIIQSIYAFPPYEDDGSNPYSGYQPIPASQANGTYTGATVTLDIAPI